MVSLRDKIYDAIRTHYKIGDEVNPYLIADICGSVNTVFHIMHTFAEEGILDVSVTMECPVCGEVPAESQVDDSWICSHCGHSFTTPVRERFVYRYADKRERRNL